MKKQVIAIGIATSIMVGHVIAQAATPKITPIKKTVTTTTDKSKQSRQQEVQNWYNHQIKLFDEYLTSKYTTSENKIIEKAKGKYQAEKAGEINKLNFNLETSKEKAITEAKIYAEKEAKRIAEEEFTRIVAEKTKEIDNTNFQNYQKGLASIDQIFSNRIKVDQKSDFDALSSQKEKERNDAIQQLKKLQETYTKTKEELPANQIQLMTINETNYMVIKNVGKGKFYGNYVNDELVGFYVDSKTSVKAIVKLSKNDFHVFINNAKTDVGIIKF